MPQLRKPFRIECRQSGLTRRDVLQNAARCSLGAAALHWLSAGRCFAADELVPLNRFPRMIQEYFVHQMRDVERKGLEAKNRLKTKADAEAYVKLVQAKIRRSFGPEPKRTPLAARVTGVVERDTYKIENVIFESRPGFPVTANLYVPKGREFPAPGVVGTCGHSTNGKAAEAYQSFAQGLARLGYVCLIYDPIGQGERLQYVKDDLSPRFRPGVTEHLIAGNQQFLVGEFLGMWRAWDGIRALDYLLTRPEVDKNQIGVTGNSGGGTMTTWLCGVEGRWAMGAPACFVTTFRRNLENELPQDTEQCPPRAVALGLDHDDFLAAMAPKPVIILAKERDYFDARGSEETYARLRRLYGLLGAEQNVALHIGPTYHGYSQENREAMYRWFNGVTKVSDATTEPEIVIEKDETLWCTPNGQVAELDARTVFSFTRDRSKELAEARGKASGEKLRTAVIDVLKLPPRKGVPDYRILRYLRSRKYPLPHAIAYAVETEPGIQALVYRLSKERWYSRPPRAGKRAVLYVAHLSSDAELREEPLIREIIESEPDSPLFTCDVRGSGESQPDTCGVNSYHHPYGSDFFYAIHSLKAMLLAAVCCGVAAKLCVWQHGLLAEEMSTAVLVFLYCWNVTIVVQVVCMIWGWVWLSRSRELAASPAVGNPDKDDVQVKERMERRRAYLGSVAWGALSLASWLTFVVTWLWKDHTDDAFVALFCFAFWHLMPLTIASYVRFASRSQWKQTRSLAAIRIAAFAGLVLPALAFTLHWLQT